MLQVCNKNDFKQRISNIQAMRGKQEISIYEAYSKPVPGGVVTIDWFCRYIQGDHRDNDIKHRLQAVADPDTPDKQRKQIKASLPCFTPSGTFSKRNGAGLIKHSGFLCLDIDGKDNPDINDWPKFRDDMMDIANVYFSALSASHKGCFVLVPIVYPEKHIKQFKAIEKDLKKHNIIVDKACVDVSRLRGVSFDPEAKINPDATPYMRVYEYEKPPQHDRPRDDSGGDFMDLIHMIIKSGIDITEDYEDWFKIGCCLASELGERGREYFHDISRVYDGYTPEETDWQYNKCVKGSGKVTKNTLFYIADNYGLNLKKARQ